MFNLSIENLLVRIADFLAIPEIHRNLFPRPEPQPTNANKLGGVCEGRVLEID